MQKIINFFKSNFLVVIIIFTSIFYIYTLQNTFDSRDSFQEYVEEMGGKLLLEFDEHCKYTYRDKYPSHDVHTAYEMTGKECEEEIVKATSQNKDMYIDCGYASDEIDPVRNFLIDGVIKEVPNRHGSVYRGYGSVPSCTNITYQKELEYRINYIEAYTDLYESCYKEHGKEIGRLKSNEWINCFTSERLYSKISIERPPTYEEWLSSRIK